MIKLNNVDRLFRSDEVETTALHAIDLEVAQGEFLAIMGPSGCGKSTLLNILGLIDRPTSGRYSFENEEVTGLTERNLARIRAKRIGFVFQNFNLIDELTVAENIELALVYQGENSASHRRASTRAAMERLGISHRANHHPNALSGGQQQRAAVARAIVGNPRLILADEPTGNLDTDNGEQVMGILKQLNADGATIVMVTHSPAHADEAKRIVDMLDGRIVAGVRRKI